MKYTTYAFQYTKDTTLRWLQYRISHRISATNEYLFKLKLNDSKLCTFCNIEPESLFHLFVECEHVENVWNMLESYFSEPCGFPLNFNKCEILFGKIGKKYEALNTTSIKEDVIRLHFILKGSKRKLKITLSLRNTLQSLKGKV